MAHTFKTLSGKKTFQQFSEPLEAGDYIKNKKIRATYCVPSSCSPNIKVSNQGDLLTLRNSYNLSVNPCLNNIDKNDLYINLITKLDLSSNYDVIPILDTSGNIIPAIISSGPQSYTRYNIDPSGNLFGNTICGINNFTNYLVYNPPP
jgi:hypothetical protein